MSSISKEIKRASYVLGPVFGVALLAASCRPPEATPLPTPETPATPFPPTPALIVEATPVPTSTLVVALPSFTPAAEPTAVLPRTAQTVDRLRSDESVLNSRYWISRETQSRDQIYQTARDMASLKASFISESDPSVISNRGVISINGREYHLGSDNDLIYANAILDAKLPAVLKTSPRPGSGNDVDGNVKKIESLYGRVNFVDADAAPFVYPEYLYPLATVVDNLNNNKKPIPHNWSRMRLYTPSYDKPTDTLNFNALNPIAALGTYYRTIEPSLSEPTEKITQMEQAGVFKKRGMGAPPNTMVFLAPYDNYFAWYMTNGTGFRDRIRFAEESHDQNAQDALNDVYGGFQKYFGFDVSIDGKPFRAPSVPIQKGDRVILVGSAETIKSSDQTTAILTVSDEQRRTFPRDLATTIQYIIDARTQDGKIISRIAASEDQISPAAR